MDNKQLIKRKALFLPGFSLLTLFMAFLAHTFYDDVVTPRQLTKKIQKKIIAKEKEVDQVMLHLLEYLKDKTAPNDYKNLYEALPEFDRKNITLCIFESDSLIFWTDNNIQIDPVLQQNQFNKSPVNLSNGWFDLRKISEGNFTVLGFIKVKMAYSYENKYLENRFASYLEVPREINIIESPNGHNLENLEGEFILSLDFSAHATIPGSIETILSLAFILSYLLLLAAMHYAYKLLRYHFKNKYLLFLGYVLDVLLIRYLLLYFNFPGFIDHHFVIF